MNAHATRSDAARSDATRSDAARSDAARSDAARSDPARATAAATPPRSRPEARAEASPEVRPATAPPEARGLHRDEVRMLVSDGRTHRHARFVDLPELLEPGDVLVVNDSGTLPASLRADSRVGPIALNLATRFGARLWLTEPRWSAARPGPLPLGRGERLDADGIPVVLLDPYPGLPRLRFALLDGDAAMARAGTPIRYAYLDDPQPLSAYQTVFARLPGSAEMPSAGRPFSARVLRALEQRGVRVVSVTLHAGVSSMEVDVDDVATAAFAPEPFEVPPETAGAVREAAARGGRVIAVGTTVVRALASAREGGRLVATRGFTRLVVHPGRPLDVVDGLLTGLHEPRSSHLAMLRAIASPDLIDEAYRAAEAEAYLWHEFGDVHLILKGDGHS